MLPPLTLAQATEILERGGKGQPEVVEKLKGLLGEAELEEEAREKLRRALEGG